MLMNKTCFEINKSLAENSLCELHYHYGYSIQITAGTFRNSGLACGVSLFRCGCGCWRCSRYQQIYTTSRGMQSSADRSRLSLHASCWYPNTGQGSGCFLCSQPTPAPSRAIRICSGSLTPSRQNHCHDHTLKLPDTGLTNFPS